MTSARVFLLAQRMRSRINRGFIQELRGRDDLAVRNHDAAKRYEHARNALAAYEASTVTKDRRETLEDARRSLLLADAENTAQEHVCALARAYLDFAARHPAVYDAMFQLDGGLAFAEEDTPEPLKEGFAALLENLSDVAGDGVHPGLFTEVFWAALHGLATAVEQELYAPRRQDGQAGADAALAGQVRVAVAGLRAGVGRWTRLRALLRRGAPQRPSVLTAGDLSLDPATRRVVRGGVEVELTAREFSLLEYLLRRQGEVVAKTELLAHVWDAHSDSDLNLVEVYVGYLRRKLDVPFGRGSLQTVRGAGYRLDPEG